MIYTAFNKVRRLEGSGSGRQEVSGRLNKSGTTCAVVSNTRVSDALRPLFTIQAQDGLDRQAHGAGVAQQTGALSRLYVQGR